MSNSSRKFFIAGNWKMNTTLSDAKALADGVGTGVGSDDRVETLVAPPFPYLMTVKGPLENSSVQLGAQNCYHADPGAFTGEVAVAMLKDIGVDYVILGHSERRHVLGETDEDINHKVRAALRGGVGVILCIGELLEEREAEQTEAVLDRQLEGGLEGLSTEELEGLVIAYEPVWAIGTGKVATPEIAEAAHAHVRGWLTTKFGAGFAEATRIQYGGSVKPDNAAGLLSQPNIDGALVGGASLKADSFLGIIEAARSLVDAG